MNTRVAPARAAAATAYAAEQPVELKPGAGQDAVQQNCGTLPQPGLYPA